MIALLCFFLTLFAPLFKSKRRLEAANAVLRRQLIILRRKVRGRVRLTNGDGLFLVQLYRWFHRCWRPSRSSGNHANVFRVGKTIRPTWGASTSATAVALPVAS